VVDNLGCGYFNEAEDQTHEEGDFTPDRPPNNNRPEVRAATELKGAGASMLDN
jgi:hypothetical protein